MNAPSPDSVAGSFLVAGANGQLGQALMERLPDAVGVTRAQLDLSEPDTVAERLEGLISQHAVEAVINAAAYTAVDAAEDDVDIADAVNARAPRVIAEVCKAAGVPLVHISTDYVFDGQATAPYPDDHPTRPVSVYGRTKRDGEAAVMEVVEDGGVAAVLRTSWVYAPGTKNFATTMLRLSETRDELSVVADQIGRPTFTGDLADAAITAAQKLIREPELAGLYHATNTGEPISWADFARAIFAQTGRSITVNSITTADYPTPATRPAYSALDTRRFETVFDHPLPDWKSGLERAFPSS